MFDSLRAAGNSFQMAGAKKLKERLLKLVMQEWISSNIIIKDSDWLQSKDIAMVEGNWGMVMVS